MAELFALEKGESIMPLHVQGIIRMRAIHTLSVNARIRHAIGWGGVDRPAGSKIIVKGLSGQKLLTFCVMPWLLHK